MSKKSKIYIVPYIMPW